MFAGVNTFAGVNAFAGVIAFVGRSERMIPRGIRNLSRLQARKRIEFMSVAEQNGVANGHGELRWPDLRQRVSRRVVRRSLATLWPECEADGSPLRWGAAVACGGHLPAVIEALAKVAAARKPPRGCDLGEAAERFIAGLRSNTPATDLLAEAVAWSYALPELAIAEFAAIPERLWWVLLGELQTLHRSASEQAAAESIDRLIAAGEIGAVLSWRLADLPSCEGLRVAAHEAIADWYDAGPYAVAAALSGGGRFARLALASALRSKRLAARQNRRVGTKRKSTAYELATRVTALTRADGSCSLQNAELVGSGRAPSPTAKRASANASDDLSRSGLLAIAAVEVGEPALRTATEAILGREKSHGRLAWKVELPEPGWSDEKAKLAVMLPEWDVRRGRVAIDYAGTTARIEISNGKRPFASGQWTACVRQKSQPLEPTSDWSDVCWYSDDDVHYLELEQSFLAGVKIQRQIMLLRDDGCLMLADAVIGSDTGAPLEYVGQLPLVSTAHIEEERETRELTVVDGKPRAVVYPLGLNEWRMGPAPGTLRTVDAELSGNAEDKEAAGLVLESRMRGIGRLYSALWFDFDRKRMSCERTWRQLTIAESLRLLQPHEAAGYRIQAGDDQWLVYRSLSGQRNRTLLGKNLVSDFFCGRFNSSDGFVEELIAVDDQPN